MRLFQNSVRLRRKTGLKDFVLDSLLKANIIGRDGPVIFMSSHRPSLSSADKPIEDALLRMFGSNFTAIGKGEIEKLGFGKDSIERVLKSLVQRKAVVKLSEGVYLSQASLVEARQRLENLFKEKGHIKASEFRDALGCGRKLAIELLEYLIRNLHNLKARRFKEASLAVWEKGIINWVDGLKAIFFGLCAVFTLIVFIFMFTPLANVLARPLVMEPDVKNPIL